VVDAVAREGGEFILIDRGATYVFPTLGLLLWRGEGTDTCYPRYLESVVIEAPGSTAREPERREDGAPMIVAPIWGTEGPPE